MYKWMNSAATSETMEKYETDTGAKLTQTEKEAILSGFRSLKARADAGEDISRIAAALLS